jgi:hypothetical protein
LWQFFAVESFGLQSPADANGQPKRDINNPTRQCVQQPIMGLTILKGLQPS